MAMKRGGNNLKPVPEEKKKSLGKLPTDVRNKIGFQASGGKVKKMTAGGNTKPKPRPSLETTKSKTKKGQERVVLKKWI